MSIKLSKQQFQKLKANGSLVQLTNDNARKFAYTAYSSYISASNLSRFPAFMRELDKIITNFSGKIFARDTDFDEEHPRLKNGEFATKTGHSNAIYDKNSKSHKDESGGELPEHIKKIKIPPNWTHVTYSTDPDASLLVTGKDAKGRPQAIYSLAHSEKQAAIKFARINELNEKYDAIEKQNDKLKKLPKTKDAADCTSLIMKTGIRPGSDADTGAKVKAYGATNLLGKHVVVKGKHVSLQFTGKKGVSLNIPVEDKNLARMLIERKKVAGEDGRVFNNLNEDKLLDHVHTLDGGRFKTKDFRTRIGTVTAMNEIEKTEAPKDEKEYKKKVMDVAKKVAQKLGNTPVVALQSYINPVVFSKWQAGKKE